MPDSVKDKIMNIQLPISETVHLMASLIAVYKLYI